MQCLEFIVLMPPLLLSPVGNTCMHLAAQQSHLETLSYLYGASVGADVNARDGLSGRTVLHWAADNGDTDLVALLMSRCGAHVHASAYDKCTPVQLAMGRGHARVVEQLATAGACLEIDESSSESDSSEEGTVSICCSSARLCTGVCLKRQAKS